jgi:16S rRNA (guanine527-N7)-methyltransferase
MSTFFADQLESLGLPNSEPILARFASFQSQLYAANESRNLTRVPPEDCEVRHFLDSLIFHDLIPFGAEVLDVGTGPGFPAWPLAAGRDDLKITAIDSNGKMLGFLATQPLPNLIVKQIRAEEWPAREEFDFVTGRAVAPLSIQLEVSAPLVKVGGLLVPMRSSQESENFASEEFRTLGIKLREVVERPLPGTDIVRFFPVYEKTKATPTKYPRRWGDIKKKPL